MFVFGNECLIFFVSAHYHEHLYEHDHGLFCITVLAGGPHVSVWLSRSLKKNNMSTTKSKRKRGADSKNTTKAWIYSVVKSVKSSTKSNAETLYKVCWCDMYKTGEGKAGCKWVLDKGTDKTVKLSPIVVDKKRVYSYIRAKYLPVAVADVCGDIARATHRDLAHLSQSQIYTDVPKAVHPYTAAESSFASKVLSYFSQNQNYNRMRIASSEEGEITDSSSSKDDDGDESAQTPPKKQRRSSVKTPSTMAITIRNGYVPHGIGSHIKTMIDELNQVYSSLPVKRTPADIARAYRVELQQKSSLWRTKDVPVTFPYHRFVIIYFFIICKIFSYVISHFT